MSKSFTVIQILKYPFEEKYKKVEQVLVKNNYLHWRKVCFAYFSFSIHHCLARLEFERTHYPDIFTRKRLSKQIRMDENRIQVKFDW